MPKPGYPFLKPVRWEGDVTELPLVPRRKPRQAPESGIFDAPFVCVPMNISWLPHIWGALDTLNQPDTWQGTDEETFIARQQIEKLLLATVEGSELCKPEPRMIPVPELVYPPWLDGAPGCWIVELDQLDGELNIIQRVDVDYCQTEDWCPPEDWIVQPETSGGSNMSAVEINKLQQQIDALQSEVNEAQESADNALSAAQFAFATADSVRNDLNELRQGEIASLRWWPSVQDLPDGWISINGQRIPRLPTTSGDSVLLYDRVPSAWRDGDDTLLPTGLDVTPISATLNGDNFAAIADGASVDMWADTSQQDASQKRLRLTRGRWTIYVGDSAIS